MPHVRSNAIFVLYHSDCVKQKPIYVVQKHTAHTFDRIRIQCVPVIEVSLVRNQVAFLIKLFHITNLSSRRYYRS